MENFKKLGEVWGKTLEVDHKFNGINNLSSAKILILTTTMKKIEERVNIKWESGSCDVWVKEIQHCGCKSKSNDHGRPSDSLELYPHERSVNSKETVVQSQEAYASGEINNEALVGNVR